MQALVILVVMGVVIPLNALFDGWCISLLWSWFIVPVFHLPVLSVVAAMGLAIITSRLTHQLGFGQKDNDSLEESFEKFLRSSFNVFILNAAFLGMGWILQKFM